MLSLKNIVATVALIVAGSSLSSAVGAAPVPNGTVSSVATFNPTLNIGTALSTYSANAGGTFQISGTGGFLNVGGLTGALNGTISFSNVVGVTLPEAVSSFFTFNDGSLGTYNYSVLSTTTNSFVNIPGAANSGTLFLLGTLADTRLGYTPTPASLTVQFNSTGGSAYSSALTLSVPPSVGAVPEPAGWAMMILGMGMIGFSVRRRSRVRTMVAHA